MNSAQHVFKIITFKSIFKLIFVLCQFLALTSCQFSTTNRPNFVIIAVESLGVNAVNCLRERKSSGLSGLDEICDNSVRFTHAFTPSILAVPALSSILTGKNPFEHKVHNNGKQGLSAEFHLLSEILLQRGYQTGFFSGGPPVLRKSQLHQGFDVFEDNLSPGKYFQNFKKTSSIFFSWLDEIKKSPFFVVFYVPDLLFEDFPTINNLGESRSLTFESQVEEFDEALGQYFTTLKKKNLWNNTYVVLVGLNAQVSDKQSALKFNLDVLSARSQVAMLIKPASKPRDQGLQWSVDKNISTLDIFPTIKEILNITEQSELQNQFQSQSFAKLLFGPSDLNKSSRWIYTESGWGEWRNIGNLRVSVREDNLVYVHDQHAALYNSLIDRFETNSIYDPNSFDFPIKAQEVLLQNQIEQFQYFQKKYQEPVLAQEKLAACSELFKRNDISFKEKRKCDDFLTLELYDWFLGLKIHPNDLATELKTDLKTDLKTEEAKRKFLRDYTFFLNDKKIAEYNDKIGRIWDVAYYFYLEKSIIEEILNSFQNQILFQEIIKNIQNVTSPNQKGTSSSSATKH